MAGKSNSEIASELMVTKYTVNYHLQQIYRKLGVSNKSDLIVKAFALMSGAAS